MMPPFWIFDQPSFVDVWDGVCEGVLESDGGRAEDVEMDEIIAAFVWEFIDDAVFDTCDDGVLIRPLIDAVFVPTITVFETTLCLLTVGTMLPLDDTVSPRDFVDEINDE